jgi:kynurenine formamidase
LSEALIRQREAVLDIAERIVGLGYALWGERTRTYVFVSKQYAAAYGLTPDEYIARYQLYEDEAAWIHPEDRERCEALYETYLENPRECSLELRYRPPAPRRARRQVSARRSIAPTLSMLGLAGVALCATLASSEPAGRIIDLTHAFDSETIFWPTEEGFVLEKGTEGEVDAGYYYAAHRFRTAEHGGTHIDAPIHFHADGWTVDEIPLDRLVGPGILVDVSDRCAKNPDHRVLVSDFEVWEKKHGQIPSASIVLIRTGFGRFWPDRKAYLGTDERGVPAVAKLHFPGLHPDAARWLIAKRKIGAVGLDTASIDHGPSKQFETHRVLFEANVPAFENLAALDELPASGFSVVALPIKIRGGSGGPLRAIAILPDGGAGSGAFAPASD